MIFHKIRIVNITPCKLRLKIDFISGRLKPNEKSPIQKELIPKNKDTDFTQIAKSIGLKSTRISKIASPEKPPKL